MTQPTLDFDLTITETLSVALDDIKPWDPYTGVRNWTSRSQTSLGQFDPVTLRRLNNDPNGYAYEVRDGTRRLNNAKKRGEEMILAVIVDTDEVGGAVLTLAAQLGRGANKPAETDALALLLEHGYEVGELAKTFGLNLGKLKQRAKLLKLPSDLQDAVKEGKVAASVAQKLLPLTNKYNAARALLAENGKLTGPDVDALSRTSKAEVTAQLGPALFELDAPDPKTDLRAALTRARAEGISTREICEIVESLGE